jgi:hypothetical protein
LQPQSEAGSFEGDGGVVRNALDKSLVVIAERLPVAAVKKIERAKYVTAAA